MPPTVDLVDDASDDADAPCHDEDFVPRPPTPERVARRALALAAVSNRGLLENEAGQLDDPDELRASLEAWIHEIGIVDELEPEEWKVIQRKVGTLDQQAIVNATWRLEGLGVLLWALGYCELPPYDQLFVPAELFEAVRLYDGEAGEIVRAAQLRSEIEIDAMAEHLLMFHWRMRNFSLRPESMDFVEFSRNCWIGTFDITNFRVINRDLAIGDQAIADATSDEVGRVHSIAMERHQAINWLLGYSDIYSETDTST
jgi:hypothetical protein